MELRQLEAFVAVAHELHFGRAAQQLHIGQPALSTLVQRLERELWSALMIRSTRRVALTAAGTELLGRAQAILDDVGAACAAVHQLSEGHSGVVRLAITPPAAPVLAPHLARALRRKAPHVELIVRRMWLPELRSAVAVGSVDVAITCAAVAAPPQVIAKVFCAEPFLVAVRRSHPVAQQDSAMLADLAGETLGVHSASLFPAWVAGQRDALEAAGLRPPMVELDDVDLHARRWPAQAEVDWVLTTPSLMDCATVQVVRPATPAMALPYTLLWNPALAASPAVGRFVHLALALDVPEGWATRPGHLRHQDAGSDWRLGGRQERTA